MRAAGLDAIVGWICSASWMVVVVIGLALMMPRDLSAFTLVTEDEFRREQGYEGPAKTRGDAKGDIGGPAIVLVQPANLKQIRSPTAIELRFLPKGPATIVVDSLRVLYGFFGLDVTKRLLGNATVTPSGIYARNASMPAGSHRITIEISDTRDRVGRKTFRFQVTN